MKTQLKMILLIFILSGLTLTGCSQVTTTTSAAPTATPAPTSTPTPSPSPSPSPIPTPTPTPPPVETLVSIAQDLPCYAEPDSTSGIICWLRFQDQVKRVTAFEHEQYAQIMLSNDLMAYCDKSLLATSTARVYANPIEGYFKSALPEADDTLHYVKLVDVRANAPEIQVLQVFATSDNLAGVRLYERPVMLLQESTLNKLRSAAAIFAKDGYTIKLIDAYRPYRTTLMLFAFYSNPSYLASPKTGSNHNRGAAVDITLVDKNGVELEMPSLLHTLNRTANRENPDMTEAALHNMNYMTDVMTSSGFSTIKSEWWHFDDVSRHRYPILDLDLGSVSVYAPTQSPTSVTPPIVDPRTSGYSPLAPTPSPSPSPSPTPSITPAQTSETSAEETLTTTSSTEIGN